MNECVCVCVHQSCILRHMCMFVRVHVCEGTALSCFHRLWASVCLSGGLRRKYLHTHPVNRPNEGCVEWHHPNETLLLVSAVIQNYMHNIQAFPHICQIQCTDHRDDCYDTFSGFLGVIWCVWQSVCDVIVSFCGRGSSCEGHAVGRGRNDICFRGKRIPGRWRDMIDRDCVLDVHVERHVTRWKTNRVHVKHVSIRSSKHKHSSTSLFAGMFSIVYRVLKQAAPVGCMCVCGLWNLCLHELPWW